MGDNGVGMPASMWLDQFGQIVSDAFDGERCYLVGSATRTTGWRDVDVRLILDDDHFERLFGPPIRPQAGHPKWAALCLAFSELGRRMTGLPIDFQIQQQTRANDENDGPRNALAIISVPGCYLHVEARDRR